MKAKFTILAKSTTTGEPFTLTAFFSKEIYGIEYTGEEFIKYVEENKERIAYDFCHWDIPYHLEKIEKIEYIVEDGEEVNVNV